MRSLSTFISYRLQFPIVRRTTFCDLQKTSKKTSKMKFIAIVIIAIVATVAVAAPLDDSKDAVVLKYENDNIGIDGYNFA